MSDPITSTKLEQTGELFLVSRCCLSALVSAFLRQAHESEVRGYLVYLLIVVHAKLTARSNGRGVQS